jgi:ankyrin repeat protein
MKPSLHEGAERYYDLDQLCSIEEILGPHRYKQAVDLRDAANRGDLGRVKELLAEGADVNAPCRALVVLPGHVRALTTALHAASFNNAFAVAELLVDHGAEVNAKNESDRTSLHAAAMVGATELVKLLLAHGAEVNVQDQKGRTPLHEAVFKGDVDVVRLLLTHGAKTNIEDEYGMTPMRLASDPKVAEVLRQNARKK